MADGVVDHYASAGLSGRIRAALEAAGLDPDDLDASALANVDEFHLGGRAATEALLADVDAQPGWSVVDVGCGIGGAARLMATHGCSVLGVDLTPSFVETARELTEAAGLHEATEFRLGSATALPADDGTADLVTMLHVGMNIDDKAAMFAEMARVTRPGGTVAVYDVMRVGDGEITFPVPWASDAEQSFVVAPAEYAAAMRAAGLSDIRETSRLQLALDAIAVLGAGPPPAVNLGHLMGPQLPAMFGNMVPLLHTGTLAPIQIIGRH